MRESIFAAIPEALGLERVRTGLEALRSQPE
jgi:hypothetical protein